MSPKNRIIDPKPEKTASMRNSFSGDYITAGSTPKKSGKRGLLP